MNRLDSQEPVNEFIIRAIFGVSFGFHLKGDKLL